MPSTSFTFSFKGDIWRMVPDEGSGYLGIEVRNPASLQVFFCVIQPACQEMLIDHLQTAERWWAGLAGLSAKAVYLHGFEQQGQLGQPKGITAIDVATQKVLFELPEYQWQGQGEGVIFVSEGNAPTKEVWQVNANTGAIENSISTSEKAILDQMEHAKKPYPVRYAQVFEPESLYFKELTAFLLDRRGQVAQGGIEYLELDSCFIISYYVRQENGLFVKFLVTYSLNGKALNEFCLLKDAERIEGSAFFVQAGQLYMVQDKRVLLSVSLP